MLNVQAFAAARVEGALVPEAYAAAGGRGKHPSAPYVWLSTRRQEVNVAIKALTDSLKEATERTARAVMERVEKDAREGKDLDPSAARYAAAVGKVVVQAEVIHRSESVHATATVRLDPESLPEGMRHMLGAGRMVDAEGDHRPGGSDALSGGSGVEHPADHGGDREPAERG